MVVWLLEISAIISLVMFNFGLISAIINFPLCVAAIFGILAYYGFTRYKLKTKPVFLSLFVVQLTRAVVGWCVYFLSLFDILSIETAINSLLLLFFSVLWAVIYVGAGIGLALYKLGKL